MKRITALDLCRHLGQTLPNTLYSNDVLAEVPFADEGCTLTTRELLERLNRECGVISLDDNSAQPNFKRGDRVCVTTRGGSALRSGTITSHHLHNNCYTVALDVVVSLGRYHHRFITKLTNQEVVPVCGTCHELLIIPGQSGRRSCRCKEAISVDPRTLTNLFVRTALDKNRKM